jgi:hypothetical protein
VFPRIYERSIGGLRDVDIGTRGEFQAPSNPGLVSLGEIELLAAIPTEDRAEISFQTVEVGWKFASLSKS